MQNLEKLAKLVRYFILVSSTEAGSGHPTSSLSATDLMTVLFFGGFYRFDLDNPENPNNDRLIFSKGHASPLFYSIYAAAGAVTEEELKTLRKFGSKLEGHPTPAFKYTEAATGSLGQGLSVGVGMALNGKYLDKLDYKTYVLLGDSEMAEGSMYEAMEIASFYKLNNLIAILDVNRLGQRGETMYGHNLEIYQKKAESFGWETFVIDGHNLEEIRNAFDSTQAIKDKPVMIIAKTLKGKGVSFIEDKEGKHGVALKPEELEKALKELGEVDKGLRGELEKPQNVILSDSEESLTNVSNGNEPETSPDKIEDARQSRHSEILRQKPQDDKGLEYKLGDLVATRKAYGNALPRIYPEFPEMVVLDAEVSNSTFSEIFKKENPERFFEMFIAEQNMVGTALGLSRRGKIPFVSTFAAFFSRAFDQIRMSQYSDSNIKFAGSHVGVSIGEDGASQMGLEDIAIFRTLINNVVLYPSDAVSTEKLVEAAAKHKGNVYIRTTRMETPVLYKNDEEFKIGGSKVHRITNHESQITKKITVVGAGVTLHEALKAQKQLTEEGIEIVVIDLYSIKPLDLETLAVAATETKAILTVEDHYQAGGLGEAVASALSDTGAKVHILAVEKMPKSGKPDELLKYESIDSGAIISWVRDILMSS